MNGILAIIVMGIVVFVVYSSFMFGQASQCSSIKHMLIKEHCGCYNKTTGEFIIKNEMICNVD